MLELLVLMAALGLSDVAAAIDPGPAAAAPQMPEDRVTLDQALARALAKSNTAEIAAAELRRAAALTEQIRAASLPIASFNLQDIYLDGARTFVVPGQGTVVATPQNTFTGNVTVTVPLVAAQQWVQWVHARDREGVAGWTEKEARRELSIAVAHAYLTVIAQRRVVEAQERARDNDESHYAFVRQRHAGGIGSNLDEIRANQQFRNDLAQVEAARLGLERTQEALGVLLSETHAVDATDTPHFDVPGDVDDARSRAPDLRVDLRELGQRREAARKVRRDDWADYFPTLSASFLPGYQNPASIFAPEWSWELMATLTFPIYDGGLRYGLAKERAELFFEADRTLAQATIQADSDIRIGSQAVRRDDTALKDAVQEAALAHQAFDVANLQYRVGAINNLDVIDAERHARDADTAVAVSEDNVRQARLDLMAALGLFPPPHR